MAKKFYAKPFMVKEQFTSNEYIAACWYVESGNCYNNLVQDRHGPFGNGDPDGDYNPWGDDLVLAKDHGTNHVLPSASADPPYFKDVDEPEDMNDYQHFYDRPSNWNVRSEFNNKITTPIYKVTYNGSVHYVKDFKRNGNHS